MFYALGIFLIFADQRSFVKESLSLGDREKTTFRLPLLAG